MELPKRSSPTFIMSSLISSVRIGNIDKVNTSCSSIGISSSVTCPHSSLHIRLYSSSTSTGKDEEKHKNNYEEEFDLLLEEDEATELAMSFDDNPDDDQNKGYTKSSEVIQSFWDSLESELKVMKQKSVKEELGNTSMK